MTRPPAKQGKISREKDRAVSRRRALQRVLDRLGLSPTEAARAAGLPSANAIFNFLHGRSMTLSALTYERLVKAIPGTSLAELQGIEEHEGELPGAIALIELRTSACAGLLRPSFDLPRARRGYVSVPAKEITQASGAFAVRVDEPGAERLFPAGTILVCVPAAAFEGEMHTGQKILLQRIFDGKVEVTIRELELEANEAWLWLRSSHPEHQAPLRMPYRLSEPFRAWRVEEDRYVIAAIAVLACVPLEGPPYLLDLGADEKAP